MHPAWARVFEPPSVTGGESQGILRTLMVLYRETGNRKYLEPIPRALAYLKRSVLSRPASPSEICRGPRGGGRAGALLRAADQPAALHHQGDASDRRGLGSRLVDGYEVSYSDAP